MSYVVYFLLEFSRVACIYEKFLRFIFLLFLLANIIKFCLALLRNFMTKIKQSQSLPESCKFCFSNLGLTYKTKYRSNTSIITEIILTNTST